MKPSVGRMVHYVSYGSPGGEYVSECRAAVVVAVDAGMYAGDNLERVTLCVLNPTGVFFNASCAHTETNRPGGSWHWPEVVA